MPRISRRSSQYMICVCQIPFHLSVTYVYLSALNGINTMLIERFVFVLYLLLGYMWFLLGTVYDTPWRYVPIVLMILTLFSIIVISLMQLQLLFLKNIMQTHDKWSTIAWSVQHMLLCIVLCADGLEWMNIVMILGFCGFIMTLTIAVVGGCACFVIMQNGEDWHAHIHLACISFWVMLQFMATRLPNDGVPIITTIPVTLMTCIRAFEGTSLFQMALWVVVILLHILRDTEALSEIYFLYLFSAVLLGLSYVHRRTIFVLIVIPFALIPTLLFVVLRLACGVSTSSSFVDVVRLYNDLTYKDLEPIVLPLEEESGDEDWSSL